MAGEHKASDFAQAFAALAADQVRDLSDEDLGWYAQATVAVLEAIDTELQAQDRDQSGKTGYHRQADRARVTT
jgi:hypothetical protein